MYLLLGMYVQESRLIEGVAFKKTFSYAGFEMQRKKFTDPKIVLLNVELELKAEKENAELRIENVEVIHVLKPALRAGIVFICHLIGDVL